jgi:hypothetical protein
MNSLLEKFGLAAVAVSILLGVCLRSLYLFWKKSKDLSAELALVLGDLEKMLGPVRKVDLAVLQQISERMAKSPVFSHYWSVFEATLIVDDVQIYNTRPFSDFIPFQELLDKQLNAKSFAKMPALVTSMGLSFTFTFIVIGLSHLKPQPSGRIEGISQLIEGLAAKFISSITALLASIMLTVAEDMLIQKLENTYHQLADLLDRKFQKQTAEDYLRSLERNMRELNAAMKESGPEAAPGTSLEAGNELKELGLAIQKLSETMSENAGQSTRSSLELEKLIAALGGQALAPQRGPGRAASAMEEGLVPLLEGVERNTKLQSESMLKVLEIMIQLQKYLEPNKLLPKKRLDDHLKEIRRIGV